jgi:acyl carrier protein
MTDRNQLMAVLTEMVGKTMFRKNVEIGPDDDLQATAGLDSMGINEIASLLEEKYNIQFDDGDVKEIKTLNTTADLLLRKIQEGQSPVSP